MPCSLPSTPSPPVRSGPRRKPDAPSAADLLIATRYDGLRARTSTPPLTAVDLGLEAISTAAVEMLVAVLKDDPTGPGGR
jgi:DNA-binding LacI/PurR family transcriptional regulator